MINTYRIVDEPEIWFVDKDGNKIAQCHPCTIECSVTTGDIRGGEGLPVQFNINPLEEHESCWEIDDIKEDN